MELDTIVNTLALKYSSIAMYEATVLGGYLGPEELRNITCWSLQQGSDIEPSCSAVESYCWSPSRLLQAFSCFGSEIAGSKLATSPPITTVATDMLALLALLHNAAEDHDTTTDTGHGCTVRVTRMSFACWGMCALSWAFVDGWLTQSIASISHALSRACCSV